LSIPAGRQVEHQVLAPPVSRHSDDSPTPEDQFMATFFWVPNRDTGYQGEFFRLATAGGKTGNQYNCKFLLPEDCKNNEYAYANHPHQGTNTAGMTAGWDALQDDDELYIGAHGCKKDSSQVAWTGTGGGTPTYWSARQLSTALSTNLLDGSAPGLHYQLYAWFGANSW